MTVPWFDPVAVLGHTVNILAAAAGVVPVWAWFVIGLAAVINIVRARRR